MRLEHQPLEYTGTFVHFEDGELGQRLEIENIPSFMKRDLPKVVLPKAQKKKKKISSNETNGGESCAQTSNNNNNKKRAVLIPIDSSGSTEKKDAPSNKKRAVLIPLTSDLTSAKPSAAFM